ncbi:VOC family protein [Zoogloea sp.]|uniref:VOC family protein n=1 Tax=Zoogloea sp. TaxID=49181 RepID=UPI00260EFB9F|nr:VOC family protein [Zoogloea sp.]MDD3352076.1 VOC family protein [Zoogloea sp.]
MISGIHHVAISTPDLPRALAFYRDLLGFREVSRTTWGSDQPKIDQVMALEGTAATTVMLQLGAICVELFQFEAPPQPEAAATGERKVHKHGITHLCFDVDDAEAEYQRLRAAGVRFHVPPQDFGVVRATYGRDPDGNVFELQQIL